MNANKPGFRLGGFEAERGEKVRRGDPDVFGLTPPPGNVPIGPAPPDVRQVLAMFDSRPIGAYDFVLSDDFDPYNQDASAQVVSAAGYITIVRRIEVEAVEGGIVLPETQLWNFSANGVVATAWNYRAGFNLSTWGVDTFFVVAPSTTMRLIAAAGFTGITTSAPIIARFIGNLLLDSNIPPTAQVGTPPHSVYVAEDRTKG